MSPIQWKIKFQIIRELTNGIFGVNQIPLLRIEPNFDLSSTCQLPLAYKNTKVGERVLIVYCIVLIVTVYTIMYCKQ